MLIACAFAGALAIALAAVFWIPNASATTICDDFGCDTINDGKSDVISVGPGGESKSQALDALKAQSQEKTNKNSPQPQTPIVNCDLTHLPCGILKTLNWILDALAYLPLSVATAFFESMVNINFTAFNAADSPYMAGVKVGWAITSGIANLFFVLILLWIAIATIFDFAPYTARQLLPKLIIMALLINFSLPIGRAFINLSNGIASIFMGAINTNLGHVDKDGDFIGGFAGGVAKIFNPEAIITTINTYYTKIDKKDAKKLLDEAKAPINASIIPGLNKNLSANDCLAYINGAPPGTGVLSWLGSFVMDNTYQNCKTFLSSLRGAHAMALAAIDAQHALVAILSMSLVGKMITTPIAIFVLFAGGVFLLVRLIALIMVLILGPAVFLLYILPATGQAWNRWWDALMKWSFFFPAFLFFLLISFIISNGIVKATLITLKDGSQGGVPDYTALLINYFIAAALMVGSLLIAQRMGVTFAGAAIALGNKWSKGVGRWTQRGMGRTALRYAAPVAKRLEESQGMAARIARTIVPGLTRTAQITSAAQRNVISRREGQIDKYTNDELKRLVAMRGTTTNTRAAALNVLKKRNDLRETDAIPGFNADRIRSVMETLRDVGMSITEHERLRPSLAIPRYDTRLGRVETQTEAIRRAVRASRPIDLENMDESEARNAIVIQELLARAGSAHAQRIAERNDNLTEEFVRAIHRLDASGARDAAIIAAELRRLGNEGLARFVESDAGRDLYGLTGGRRGGGAGGGGTGGGAGGGTGGGAGGGGGGAGGGTGGGGSGAGGGTSGGGTGGGGTGGGTGGGGAGGGGGGTGGAGGSGAGGGASTGGGSTGGTTGGGTGGGAGGAAGGGGSGAGGGTSGGGTGGGGTGGGTGGGGAGGAGGNARGGTGRRGVPPDVEARFRAAGLEGAAWWGAGFDSVDEAQRWNEVLRNFTRYRFSRNELTRATVARLWRDEGFSPDETRQFIQNGVINPRAARASS